MEDYIDIDNFIKKERKSQIDLLVKQLNDLFNDIMDCNNDPQLKEFHVNSYNDKVKLLNELRNIHYNS
jgi:hypothetical protein